MHFLIKTKESCNWVYFYGAMPDDATEIDIAVSK